MVIFGDNPPELIFTFPRKAIPNTPIGIVGTPLRTQADTYHKENKVHVQ